MAAPLAWSRWWLSHSWWLTPLPHRGTLALLAYAPVGQGRQPLGVGGKEGLGGAQLEVCRGPVAEVLLASPRGAVGY
jgi:hypothetical protein